MARAGLLRSDTSLLPDPPPDPPPTAMPWVCACCVANGASPEGVRPTARLSQSMPGRCLCARLPLLHARERAAAAALLVLLPLLLPPLLLLLQLLLGCLRC